MGSERVETSPANSWLWTIRTLAMVVGAIGLVVLVGWTFAVGPLKSLIPGAVQMKANTAVALLLASCCLYTSSVKSSRALQNTGQVLACVVIAIGAATLLEYVLDLSFGIDELLFHDADAQYAVARGRMSPYSSVAFMAIGTALLIPKRESWRPELYLGTVVATAIGLTSLLGYLWNAQELITDQWLPPVAIHTAVSFVLLSLGIVLSHGVLGTRRAAGPREQGVAVESKVLYGFGGAIALMCLSGGITYRMQVNFDASEKLIMEGRPARTSLQKLYASVADAESAQRTYMLLRDDASRTRFESAIAQIKERLETTRQAYADNSEATSPLRQLAFDIDARTQVLAREMQSPDHPVATGIAEMQAIRDTVTRLDEMSASLRTTRIATLAQHRSYTLIALLITLSIATAALLTLFTSIVRDIRERARINRELNEAQREAQRATLAKSEFLAAMSHEIRTPMNGVIGMLELLQQSSLMGQQSEMVQLTRESADALLSIIDDILDFSKIEAGRLEIESAPMCVADVVEKNCALLNRLAERRQIVLTSFCDPAIPALLMGDATRLRQILVNLLGNALKFSGGPEKSGRVSVRAQLVELNGDHAVVEFVVSDNGIGMDESTQLRLFSSFMQADVSTTRRFGGTGLGLAICKQLTTLMNGSISVRSTPQIGSAFTTRFRFSVAPQAQETQPVSRILGLSCLVIGSSSGLADDLATYLVASGARVTRVPDGVPINDWPRDQIPGIAVCVLEAADDFSTVTRLYAAIVDRTDLSLGTVVVVVGRQVRNPRADVQGFILIDGNALARQTLIDAVALAAGRTAVTPAPQKIAGASEKSVQTTREDAIRERRLILVAEDNQINQKVIGQQLTLLGYCADVVENGRIAYERWQSGDYGLLLADLHMPEMDGYALTVQIRLQERGKSHIPIVALTANALAGEAERCRSLGMDDYLTKPASVAAMGEVISKWLPAPSRNTEDYLAPVPAPSSAFNMEMLKALIGNDSGLIAEVIGDFCVLARQMTEQLIQSCTRGDLAESAAIAHKLKSSAASVGATGIAQLCATIEQNSPGGQSARLAELTGVFRTEMAVLLDQMETCLASTTAQRRAAGSH